MTARNLSTNNLFAVAVLAVISRVSSTVIEAGQALRLTTLLPIPRA